MIVLVLVLFSLHFLVSAGRLLTRRFEVGLHGVLGTYRTQRDRFLKVLMPAGRTLRRRGGVDYKVFELVSASSTLVFVDWHGLSSVHGF